MKALDVAFLHRVYRTTGWLWALGILLSLGLPGPARVILGLTLGTAVGLLLLRTTELAVIRATAPGDSSAGWLLPTITVAKLVVVGAVLYLVVAKPWISLPALVVGLSLGWLVIVLKVFGLVLQDRLKGTED